MRAHTLGSLLPCLIWLRSAGKHAELLPPPLSAGILTGPFDNPCTPSHMALMGAAPAPARPMALAWGTPLVGPAVPVPLMAGVMPVDLTVAAPAHSLGAPFSIRSLWWYEP